MIKAFGFTLVKSCDLENLRERILNLEKAQRNYNDQAVRHTECQISVFSQIASRLKLMETMHGVRFEPFGIEELNKSGSGQYVAVEKRQLRRLINSLQKQWNLIENQKREYKKWGIKKK